MKLALIGYGKMGHAIEQIARSRGHEIVSIIDVNNPEEFESEAFRSADVAIEFTAPSVALGNYRKAFAAGVPVVSGTTGWLEHLSEIQEACRNGQTFFYASNFSLGVNIFFALNKYLAGIMNQFPAYDVKMEETHHIHKLDAPSGTAITPFYLQYLCPIHGQLKGCLQHFRCALTHHHTSKEYLKILIHAADLRINLQIQ